MAIDTMYPHLEGQSQEPAFATVVMVRNEQNTAIALAKDLVDLGYDAGVDFYAPEVRGNGPGDAPYGAGNCGASFTIDAGVSGITDDIDTILAARAP